MPQLGINSIYLKMKNVFKKTERDGPRDHGFFRMTLPKIGFIAKFVVLIRESRIAKSVGRKDESLDVFLPHLEAKTANRYQSVATTTEAEAEVRKATYQIKKDQLDRQEEILADQLRMQGAWKNNEVAQLQRRKDSQMAGIEERIHASKEKISDLKGEINHLAHGLGATEQAAPIKLRAFWLIPVLIIIGLADWLGITDALTPLGMTRTNAEFMALGIAFTFVFISHTIGSIVRKHQNLFGAIAGIGIFLIPLLAIQQLAKMRAAFLEAAGGLPEGPNYVDAFSFLLLSGFVAGALVGYFGAHPMPAEVKAFNRAHREKADLEAHVEQLEDSKAKTEEAFQTAMAALEDRYRAEWRETMETLPQKFEAEFECASRDYLHLSVAMRELGKQADAQLQAETALVKTRFVLAGGKLSEPKETAQGSASSKIKAGIVGILIAFNLAVGMSGCSLIEDSNQGQTSHVILLHDRTASFELDRPFTDAEILSLSHVDSTVPALWNGGKWEFSVIDGAFVSTTLHDELPAASARNSNMLSRKKRVKEWMVGFNYASLIQNAPALSDATNLIDPMSQSLFSLVESEADRKLLVISSDLVHCERGSVCLADDESYALIQDDPDEVIEQLERIAALPADLDGIEVILLTHIESSNESQSLRVISRFWSDWLRDRGAVVSIRGNLPQVW